MSGPKPNSPQLSSTRLCLEGSCRAQLPASDAHPHCFLHRGCRRTKAGGEASDSACKYCRSWSSLQLEACLKRRMVWERSRTPSAESDGSSSESRAPPPTSPALSLASMPSVEPTSPSVQALPPSGPDRPEDDRRGSTPNLAQPPDFCAQILAALSRQEEAANQRFAALECRLGEVAARVASPPRPSPGVLPSPPHPPCVCAVGVSGSVHVAGPTRDY